MGKFVKEDLRRPENWASLPGDLSWHVPAYTSTQIVCERCGSPIGGLRYISETDTFEHRERKMCLTRPSR